MRAAFAGAGQAAAGIALLLAAAGCDCGETGLKKGGPTIQVEPAELSIDGIPTKVTEALLKVSNIGGGVLVLDPPPQVVENDGDADVEYAVPEVGRFALTCDQAAREPTRPLGPGDCALLLVRYLPARNGLDEAVLHIYNSDPERPDFEVPIHGNAQTPAIEVCAYDGQSEIDCNVDTEYDVDFGISPPGTETRRTLKVRSNGSRSLVVSRPVLVGDADFTAELGDLGAQTTTLEAGTDKSIELVFNALTGGGRAATLTIASNDPQMSPLHVNLAAKGDGPRLCLSASTLDFGPVPVGGTMEKTLQMSSCGTKPLELRTLALADSGGIFAATLPTVPRTLSPGDAAVPVPVRFSPTAPDRYQGRINLTTDTEQGFVVLAGQGVESGCKLEGASAVLDFGQVQIGVQARRDYTVANRGTKDCVVNEAPVIALGANAVFAMAGMPSPGTVVAPGEMAKFTVSYTPADASTDTGRMDVRYAEDTAGAPGQTLQVTLKGAPVAEPKCVITVQPRAGSTANFGQVRIWQEKVLPFALQNVGSSNCTVTGARISESFMSERTGGYKVKTPPKATLIPGETTVAEVAFTPRAEGLYGTPLPGFPGGAGGSKFLVNTSDQVTFTGQACTTFSFPPTTGAPGCVGWDLTGEGVQGSLQILPYDVNFGLVTLGCRSREQIITLYNVGQALITVSEIKVDPPTPAGQRDLFVVTAPPVPFTIPGGGRQQLTVRYRPTDATVHTASLLIKSDATNSAAGNQYMTVGLRGEGTTNSHQTDVFDQSARPKSDVLFIIDNSGSMGEEQNALAANAQTFLQTAISLNTDFQLGVVTVDMDDAADSGNLKGNPKIIKSTDANPAAAFASVVRAQGTNGSGTEKGLAAMNAALSPPLITDPALNGGFLRNDAKLAVIVVSDEDDQSSGTIQFYTDFLRSLKGQYNAGLVSLSAIVGDTTGTNSSGASGCTSSNGDAVAGDRYVAVQQATGGKFRSICSSNWGLIASELGLDAFGSRAGYPLSRVPVAGSIAVTVNGAASTSPAWTYDSPTNAVVFDAASLPPPGARVVIDYETACL